MNDAYSYESQATWEGLEELAWLSLQSIISLLLNDHSLV